MSQSLTADSCGLVTEKQLNLTNITNKDDLWIWF